MIAFEQGLRLFADQFTTWTSISWNKGNRTRSFRRWLLYEFMWRSRRNWEEVAAQRKTQLFSNGTVLLLHLFQGTWRMKRLVPELPVAPTSQTERLSIGFSVPLKRRDRLVGVKHITGPQQARRINIHLGTATAHCSNKLYNPVRLSLCSSQKTFYCVNSPSTTDLADHKI